MNFFYSFSANNNTSTIDIGVDSSVLSMNFLNSDFKPVMEEKPYGYLLTLRNIYKGIDIFYELSEKNIKEKIIVKNKDAVKGFSVAITTKNITIINDVKNKKYIYLDNSNNEIYNTAYPYVVCGLSDKVLLKNYVKLEYVNNKFNYIFNNNLPRKFPVEVDPSFNFATRVISGNAFIRENFDKYNTMLVTSQGYGDYYVQDELILSKFYGFKYVTPYTPDRNGAVGPFRNGVVQAFSDDVVFGQDIRIIFPWVNSGSVHITYGMNGESVSLNKSLINGVDATSLYNKSGMVLRTGYVSKKMISVYDVNLEVVPPPVVVEPPTPPVVVPPTTPPVVTPPTTPPTTPPADPGVPALSVTVSDATVGYNGVYVSNSSDSNGRVYSCDAIGKKAFIGSVKDGQAKWILRASDFSDANSYFFNIVPVGLNLPSTGWKSAVKIAIPDAEFDGWYISQSKDSDGRFKYNRDGTLTSGIKYGWYKSQTSNRKWVLTKDYDEIFEYCYAADNVGSSQILPNIGWSKYDAPVTIYIYTPFFTNLNLMEKNGYYHYGEYNGEYTYSYSDSNGKVFFCKEKGKVASIDKVEENTVKWVLKDSGFSGGDSYLFNYVSDGGFAPPASTGWQCATQITNTEQGFDGEYISDLNDIGRYVKDEGGDTRYALYQSIGVIGSQWSLTKSDTYISDYCYITSSGSYGFLPHNEWSKYFVPTAIRTDSIYPPPINLDIFGEFSGGYVPTGTARYDNLSHIFNFRNSYGARAMVRKIGEQWKWTIGFQDDRDTIFWYFNVDHQYVRPDSSSVFSPFGSLIVPRATEMHTSDMRPVGYGGKFPSPLGGYFIDEIITLGTIDCDSEFYPTSGYNGTYWPYGFYNEHYSYYCVAKNKYCWFRNEPGAVGWVLSEQIGSLSFGYKTACTALSEYEYRNEYSVISREYYNKFLEADWQSRGFGKFFHPAYFNNTEMLYGSWSKYYIEAPTSEYVYWKGAISKR